MSSSKEILVDINSERVFIITNQNRFDCFAVKAFKDLVKKYIESELFSYDNYSTRYIYVFAVDKKHAKTILEKNLFAENVELTELTKI